MSFKLTARPEECVSKAPREPPTTEDEPQAPLSHEKKGVLEIATRVGAEPPTSSTEEGKQGQIYVADEAKQSSPAEDSSKVMTDKEQRSITACNKGAPVDGSQGKQEVTNISNPDRGSDMRLHEILLTDVAQTQDTRQDATSDIFVKQEPGAQTYFETSSENHGGLSPQTQSYYELGTAALLLSGETGDMRKNLEEQQDKTAEISPSKMSATSANLCPVSGSLDEPEVYPSTPSDFPPDASIAPTSSDSPEVIHMESETPQLSDKHSATFQPSSSVSEMLDLAGAFPPPSQERREVDHMRRRSVPVDVSALARLSIRDQAPTMLGGESPLDELGYCVFSEYSGPMPSPADGDSPHQRFASTEREVEEVRVKDAGRVQKRLQQTDLRGSISELSQNIVTEKKGSPVKTSLILEKAVTSGVKPDRLRIPMISSKPGDIKIQVIPEVDIEKDPSREASPIPPDNSFTFTPTETESRVPLTPTSHKPPDDTPLERQDCGEKAGKDVSPELETENGVKLERTDKQQEFFKEMSTPEQKESVEASEEPTTPNTDVASPSTESSGACIESQSEHGTPARLENIEKHDTSKTLQDLSTDAQKVTLERGSPKPQITSPIIIIPQAQEEADDEDDIEIAEEPQEIMDEAEEPVLAKTDPAGQRQKAVRLMVDDQMLEEDPKSGAEDWSHSAQNSDDGEPATDSSHLSPCSDHELPIESANESGRGERMGEAEDVAAGPQTDREEVKRAETVKKDLNVDKVSSGEIKEAKADEEDDVEKCQEVEETSNVASQAANDETTMDISVLDTDSGWMDSQGTESFQK